MAAGAPSLEVRGRATAGLPMAPPWLSEPSRSASIQWRNSPGSWPLGGSVSTASLSTRGNNPSSGSAVAGCLFLLVGEGV